MSPIVINLDGLRAQFGLSADSVDTLTEICIKAVTGQIYNNWQALAKQALNGTRPEYLQNLNVIDKGRFAQQIILTGVLPNMLEQGASPFDMKEGFRKSQKVRYSPPVYRTKDGVRVLVKEGGWYLTIPFRIGTPGTAGQAGFSGEMPEEVYQVVKSKTDPLTIDEIPDPYNQQQVRQPIYDQGGAKVFDSYKHRNSIYEGLAKRTGVYRKTTQNHYGTFRRVSENSDPMSWIHKGLTALNLAEKAIERTDVETIVNNEVLSYLDQTI